MARVISLTAFETIARSPDDVLAFVMDPERYALVDRKIRPVRWVRRDGDVCEFGFRPSLLGIPGPTTVSRMRLTPGVRVDVSLAPAPANRLTRLLADLDASFVVTPVAGGTRLDRRLTFRFAPVARLLVEPALRRGLAEDVRTEVRRAKEHLESGS